MPNHDQDGKRKRDSSSSQNEDQESQKSKKLRVDADSLKVFNDPIHGHIELHPLCVQIIDTPQFQRLRYIKQLGCGYLVFPGAAHNRFEHSLGVCHLAKTFCRTLQERQPDLNITEKDVLCVEIAGLCHDLGHGPFSHVFDQLFIPKVEKGSDWKHEQASVDMFDHLIDANEKVQKGINEYGLTKPDIRFIKDLIKRKKQESARDTGRNKDKNFLYEIVANERSGIDVDKWDYFLRDCHNLGMTSSFDCHRFMKFSRVIEVDGRKQICARDKEEGNLYDMFYTRYSLHRRAYQHKVTKIIEIMLVEALEKANDHFLVEGKEGTKKTMSEAIHDMVAYTKLTDDIILQIMRSDVTALAESRRILEMVQQRELYKFIGEIQLPDKEFVKKNTVEERKKKIKEEIIAAQKPEDTDGVQLTADQLIIHIVDMNFGKGSENPIDNVRFYSKANLNKAFPMQGSQMFKQFAEQHIRVYCKRHGEREYIDKVRECFKSWHDKMEDTWKLQASNVLQEGLKTPENQKTSQIHPTASKKAVCKKLY